MAQPLSKTDIEQALKSLQGWEHEDNKLQKEFSFEDFREAMGFITRIAFEAEERVHHPEIFNVYNSVHIALSTHDADDKVTQKDVELAQAIETLHNQ